MYCAVALALRLLLSSNIESDESFFVGKLAWFLGYGKSQPPLYHWLVILVMRAFDYWPAISILKYASLTATALLVYDTTRRASDSRVTGAMAALSLAFIHQIIWLSQLTLSHAVLAIAAAAATLHALTLVLQRGSIGNFIWLGVAVTVGLLSKYNFAVYVISVVIAAVSMREFRVALWRPQLAITTAIVCLAVEPHGLWAAQHPDATTVRAQKLYTQKFVFGYRLALGGLTGLASLLWAALSSVVPMAAIRVVVEGRLSRSEPSAVIPPGTLVRKLCLRTLIVAVGICAVVVVAGGVKNVPERYLASLVIPFPIWLALAYPLEWEPRVALRYAAIAATTAVLCMMALTARMLFGANEYTFPYKAVAADITKFAQPPFAVFARTIEQRANIVIRIPGAQPFDPKQVPPRVLAVWNAADGERPKFIEPTLGKRYESDGPAQLIEHPYAHFSRKQARIYAQLWRIKGDSDAAPPDRSSEEDAEQTEPE